MLPAGETCAFRRTRSEDPVLIAAGDGSVAITQLNGVILTLPSVGDGAYGVAGIELRVAPIDALRAESELTFRLDPGPDARFRGFWSCSSA